ncbi:MAG: hypothetical protein CMO61_01145 [Verrucomicrobiales bacterium]|jgi:DNA repair exonuclease SbcCD ATPase subunit|nr:hypothetical protein [Verrucomicrobiales bacterium]|tara:strand:- start:5541 stop:6206 length:666 start_codon:yes stop_codon:yes gene_type:complete
MSVAAEIQPMFFDEEGGNDLDIQFDPQQFEAVTPYSDDLNDEYQQAQDQLRQLRQQEEQIKRQAAELEELTKREEQFKEGRVDVTEDITRYLSVLDRESTEAQRVAEECAASYERLEGHLSNINALHPESWSRADRKTELASALSCIEAAEDEIDNLMPLVNSLGVKKSSSGGILKMGSPSMRLNSPTQQGNFLYWLRSGFAFSLPLVAFAAIALIIVFLL